MEDTLIQSFKDEKCDDESNLYSKKCNKLLLKKEILEREYLRDHPDENENLYPNLNDPEFNVKLASKKEFNDYKYDGTLHDIKSRADELSKSPFELAPHQMFIKNYLSFQTPYNSLLLYHQLGTGKTCSAIGVTEEMRSYLRDVGITKRIIIVASPNVQENFKLQLFDERKLTSVNGVWKMDGCLGNKFLKEINPTNVTGIPKDKIISQIKTLIDKSYLFRGYEGFSNYINKVSGIENPNITEKQIIRNLQSEFSNRMIVIDEVHNIRTTQDNANKKVADQLTKLVQNVDNIRLLLLSATPMYNSVREIIWLLNLMNINDRRGKIFIKDIFDNKGKFKKNGEELLRTKATGYVSYVRGENPYTFPFRVYPNIFSPKHSFNELKYPSYQMNGKYIPVINRLRSLKKVIYISEISKYQDFVYNIMIKTLQDRLRNENDGNNDIMSKFENLDSFNYTLLQIPLEALIMTYPAEGIEDYASKLDNIRKEIYSIDEELEKDDVENEEAKVEVINEVEDDEKFTLKEPISQNPSVKVDEEEKVKIDITEKPSSEGSIPSEEYDELQKGGENEEIYVDTSSLTGKKGLNRIMNFVDSQNPKMKGSFSYKSLKYGRIFSPDEIGKYSTKIKSVCNSIANSEGIVLIYSQWLDSGLIPMALALEEMGFTRAIGNSLFENSPVSPIDYISMKSKEETNTDAFSSAKYAFITGDPRLSPNNVDEINLLTGENNVNGKMAKVVLISKAASEGIDLKNIRQVHILEPWYTMSRIEQIIGRAVRSFSHQKLPFEKRNVEIFLHGTILKDKDVEATDLYIYRLAEYKAQQIGEVTRVLKESAVDCLLNTEQNNFAQENMNMKVQQELSDGQIIDEFKVGDMSYSAMCDYMESCSIKCVPNKLINEEDIKYSTYDEGYIRINSEKIIQKIKNLMKESFFYKKSDLMAKLNYPKAYPHVEIYAALTHLITDATEIIMDKYNRQGKLINIGEYYLFQPLELTNKNASIYDRSVPIDYKPVAIQINSKKTDVEPKTSINVESAKNVENKIEEEELNVLKLNQEINNGKLVFENIKNQYETAMDYISSSSNSRLDKDFYKNMGAAIKKINDLLLVDVADLKKFVIYHSIDTLPYSEKLELLNYITSLKDTEEETIEFQIKLYFDKFLIIEKYLSGIIFYDGNIRHILVFDKKNDIWKDALPEDERDLSRAITEKYTVNTGKFNKELGLISDRVFKVKDATNKRSHGTTCQQTTKSKNIGILNKLVSGEIFTKESVKPLTDIGLCAIQEILMRHFNETKPDKIWFVNPDTAKMYNL